MREKGNRGVALAIAVSVTFGASFGILASRWTALAAEPAPDQTSRSLPLIRPLEPRAPLADPIAVATALRALDRRGPSREPCGESGSRIVRFRVAIGRGIDLPRTTFARAVRGILCDARGWTASGRVRFVYDPRGSYLVSLRSAADTESRCLGLIGLSVGYRYSCAGTREAVLNARRWFGGSPTLSLRVRAYRALLVNHEVGHLLGHGHLGCSRAGARAPVMMQQSKGLGGCRANAWPLRYELASTR